MAVSSPVATEGTADKAPR